MAPIGQTEAFIVDALETHDELRGYHPEPMEQLEKVREDGDHFLLRGNTLPEDIREEIDDILR